MELSQVLKTTWAGGVFRLFNGLEGCPRPRKIGQNRIYFEHIFLRPKRCQTSREIPGTPGTPGTALNDPRRLLECPRFAPREKTWDTWDSVPEKTDTPGFSHESNVFKITGLGRGLSTPWRVQRRRTQRNIAFAMKTGGDEGLGPLVSNRVQAYHWQAVQRFAPPVRDDRRKQCPRSPPAPDKAAGFRGFLMRPQARASTRKT